MINGASPQVTSAAGHANGRTLMDDMVLKDAVPQEQNGMVFPKSTLPYICLEQM